MASLMENLIDVLYKESTEYETLLGLSMKKTPIIVSGNVQDLQKITDEEQEVVSKIHNLERTRISVSKDIASVLNMDVEKMKLSDMVEVLKDRPEEQQKLIAVQQKLSEAVHQVQRINSQNGMLISQALDMVDYEINLFQSMKKAPETANYNRGAYSTGSSFDSGNTAFDAKQ